MTKDIEKVYIRLLNQFTFCCYTSKKSIIFVEVRKHQRKLSVYSKTTSCASTENTAPSASSSMPGTDLGITIKIRRNK